MSQVVRRARSNVAIHRPPSADPLWAPAQLPRCSTTPASSFRGGSSFVGSSCSAACALVVTTKCGYGV